MHACYKDGTVRYICCQRAATMIVDTDAKLRADGLTEKQITARLQSNTHTAFMTRLTTQLSAHAIGLGFRSKRADPNERTPRRRRAASPRVLPSTALCTTPM